MHLYEWAGKDLLRGAGIAVPRGRLAHTPEQAAAVCEELGGTAILKAQVRQGRRGKAGLIRKVDSGEAAAVAADLLAASLEGEPVQALLVEEPVAAGGEWYAAVTMDDLSGRPVALVSLKGGADVETEAEPPMRMEINPLRGLSRHDAATLWRSAGLRGLPLRSAADALVGLYKVFVESDAVLVEVNPLFFRGDDPPIAGDAKVVIDESSLFRHPQWKDERLADPLLHPLERKAASLGVVYVELDGDIAVLSGGAGATMALLDAIQHHGGRPANFLDAAGGSGPETLRHMVDLVLEKVATDDRVKAVVLNVTVAGTPLESFVKGATAALSQRPPRVPIFGCVRAAAAAVRTMSLAEGETILSGHGVRLFPDLRQAVLAAVACSRGDQ